MPPLSRLRRLGTLVGAYLVIVVLYAIVGFVDDPGPLHTLDSPIDRAAPFSPPWVAIYAAVYLQAVAPACVLTDVRVLDRTVAGYLSVNFVAVPIWVLYPVGAPRTPIEIHDVWTYGVALVRALDPAINCLPSMHVAFATLAALVVRRHDRPAGTALLIWAALISGSTLMIDQHWFADCALGAALGWLADRVWLGGLPREHFQPLPRVWHGVWIGLYLGAVLVLMSGWWLGWMPLDWLRAGGITGG